MSKAVAESVTEIIEKIMAASPAERADIADEYSLADLVKAQAHAREQYEAYKAMAGHWNALYDVLSLTLVPTKMEEEEVESTKISGVGRINLRADMWTKTQDSQKLAMWFHENGLDDIPQETVNGSTLKAFIKEQMGKKDGLLIPEEIVSITPYTRAVITKQ